MANVGTGHAKYRHEQRIEFVNRSVGRLVCHSSRILSEQSIDARADVAFMATV